MIRIPCIVNVCSPAAGVKLNTMVFRVMLTVGWATGASVELSEGQGIVLRKSGAVAEQVEVHPPSTVAPEPGEIFTVDGSSTTEILLETEVTGVTVQATVTLPNCSKTP